MVDIFSHGFLCMDKYDDAIIRSGLKKGLITRELKILKITVQPLGMRCQLCSVCWPMTKKI